MSEDRNAKGINGKRDFSVTANKPETSVTISGSGHQRICRGRAEKQARKMLLKRNSKPIPGVAKVVIRSSRFNLTLENVEVYQNPGATIDTENYVIFGDMKKNLCDGDHAVAMAAKNLETKKHLANVPKSRALEGIRGDSDTEDIDDSGIDEKDIELVMAQTDASRAKAIRALIKNDNDIVNAIMELGE